jgi:hypothetical protein
LLATALAITQRRASRCFQALDKATAIAAPPISTTEAVVVVFSAHVFAKPATYVRATSTVANTTVQENTALKGMTTASVEAQTTLAQIKQHSAVIGK